ncbi:DNA topoisomerase IB [bacterium]|nr:DNA topoisomerase IB [bacterium]
MEAELPETLNYTSDDDPGISRKGAGKGFAYYDPDGGLICDDEVKARLNSLAVPPAYHDVWFAVDPRGHLQATGIDEAGRKQYRYHSEWSDWRQSLKFDSLLEFGKALPGLRASVRYQLAGEGFGKDRILAAVVRLLDRTAARIGNEAYYQENGTSGLTTLRDRHVETEDGHLLLSYTAKGGEDREFDLYQPKLAEIVQDLQELPGQRLFQFRESGRWVALTSGHVNEWIKEKSGLDASAKDFRTWHASEMTLETLSNFQQGETQKERIAQEKEALLKTSHELGHRPPVCRKHYVHPEILKKHRAGTLDFPGGKELNGLSRSENELLSFLEALA